MKREKKGLVLRRDFVPAFWNEADGRSALVKEIRRRVETLKSDTGADSAQKRMLVERAVFIGLQLETMERTATDTGKLEVGVYTQATNALLGLLKALGLSKAVKSVGDLKAYLNGGQHDGR